MFASKITRTIEVPGEPRQSVTFRALSHYQLMMAMDARETAMLRKLEAMGDAASKLPQQTGEDREQAKAAAEEPTNKYDRSVVLRAGIAAWTAGEVTAEAIDDLTEDVAAWAFGEIIGMSVRPEAERKNSAGVSQPTSEALAGGPAS